MKPPGRTLIMLLVVVGMVVAFLAGAGTASGSTPAEVEALTLNQTAAVQASNVLLLDQGPAYVYLPLVLRH